MFTGKKDIDIDILQDELFSRKKLTVSVLRLDMLHPIVSGNKLFKLHYFLEEAVKSSHKTIITFGGAYSNHLVATAYACQQLGLKTSGIIRGERPAVLSHTLNRCIEYGMQLKFISRADYSKKEDPLFLQKINDEYGDHILIPEGGYHPLGSKGAALIMDLINDKNYSHVCCAIGTASTVAGLLQLIKKEQQLMGFIVLKSMADLDKRIQHLTPEHSGSKNFTPVFDYSFNGYAKHNTTLIQFMNRLYEQHRLPTDFVYTGKMMYGVYDMIRNGHFPEGSNIICIHTGGVQGNLSLPENTLVF